jgi:hypothetical protein
MKGIRIYMVPELRMFGMELRLVREKDSCCFDTKRKCEELRRVKSFHL